MSYFGISEWAGKSTGSSIQPVPFHYIYFLFEEFCGNLVHTKYKRKLCYSYSIHVFSSLKSFLLLAKQLQLLFCEPHNRQSNALYWKEWRESGNVLINHNQKKPIGKVCAQFENTGFYKLVLWYCILLWYPFTFSHIQISFVFFYLVLHSCGKSKDRSFVTYRNVQNYSKAMSPGIQRLLICDKVVEYDYTCNIWNHWSPLMTHSLWWYCEAISLVPVVLFMSVACRFPRYSVCS